MSRPLQVCVTGHTSGLGKAIYNFYSQHHRVIGVSTSNGYDLRDWSVMQKVVDITANYDLIFSNAKPDFFQTEFLYELAKSNNFYSKVVSIGSMIINTDVGSNFDIGINLYKTQKLALQNAHKQITARCAEFKSVLIHPAHLYDTDGTVYRNIDDWVKIMHDVVMSNSSGEFFVR